MFFGRDSIIYTCIYMYILYTILGDDSWEGRHVICESAAASAIFINCLQVMR